ncbi:MAG TPA: hypothetical protein VJA82_10760 [Sediminibacterium sp.]|nr:hypothetical protein [Sediminibacterium sp.]
MQARLVGYPLFAFFSCPLFTFPDNQVLFNANGTYEVNESATRQSP